MIKSFKKNMNPLLDDSSTFVSELSTSLEEATDDDLFEKLKVYSNNQQENKISIRIVLETIRVRIKCSDWKISEKIIEKFTENNFFIMGILIKSLKNCEDNTTIYKLINILRECISIKNIKTKSYQRTNKVFKKAKVNSIISQLITLDIVKILLKILINLQQSENNMFEQIVQETIWTLNKVAHMDKHFVIKVKSLNAVKLFHKFLKLYYNKNKVLFSVLCLIKLLSKNAVVGQSLITDGIALTLAETFIYLGHNPCSKLRILIDCLKFLTLNKTCCIKFIEVGIVELIMKIFAHWKKFDGQLRFKISSYALITLHHLTKINKGKQFIRMNNGLQLLHHFCITCPEDKVYDHLLLHVYKIINQCLQKHKLSISDISPVRFRLPDEIPKKLKSVQHIRIQNLKVHDSSRKFHVNLKTEKKKNNYNYTENSTKIKDTSYQIDNHLYSEIKNLQRTEKDISRYRYFFREFDKLHLQGSKMNLHSLKEEDFKIYSRNNILKLNSNYFKNRNNKQDISKDNIYCSIANTVKSIIPFFKIAYPDIMCNQSLNKIEPLNLKNRQVCRDKILTCIDRAVYPTSETQNIVYDLDVLIKNLSTYNHTDTILRNCDETKINKQLKNARHLYFESRFESGNLRKAIQIGPREYNLILTPDVNSHSQHQWFYFEVSNMEAACIYTFNIINCEKSNSQFNFGMKPIIFSVIEALSGRTGWVRTGMDICYYKNCYCMPFSKKNYFTISFKIIFPHSYDICYLAYHFPYTYSYLTSSIWKWLRIVDQTLVYFRADKLCDTLNGNENPLITITAPDSYKNPIHTRKVIFLTSRVHPGESNASWIMHGTLEALLGNSTYVSSLRNDYVFKIIPMLNIEGVINGCNRYGLTKEDLNRCWINPKPHRHPTIYHTKGLMEYCSRVLLLPPFIFVDYHGHSRRKNVFLFGCSNIDSCCATDCILMNKPFQHLVLPHLMQKNSPAFALPLCSFKIERHKESTARVTIWRQFNVIRSYTMESSFCGCDQGPLAGYHFNIKHLLDIGHDFCKAVDLLKYSRKIEDINTSEIKYCCPLQCIFKKSIKVAKCIQDKNAKQHILEIF